MTPSFQLFYSRCADCSYWFECWFWRLISPNASVSAGLVATKDLFPVSLSKNGMCSQWALIWQQTLVFSIIVSGSGWRQIQRTDSSGCHHVIADIPFSTKTEAGKKKRALNSTSWISPSWKYPNTDWSLLDFWQARSGIFVNINSFDGLKWRVIFIYYI